MIETAIIDNRRIAFTASTEFLVQVGKGEKGAYSTRYCVKGDPARAVLLFDAINIGRGYKKRLLMPSCSKHPCIARAVSF